MDIPQTLRYTKSHEWAKHEAGEVVMGITAHAQEELRDVVYVELPAVGSTVKQGEAMAVVESVKAAFDIYAPVSGTITRANTSLAQSPQLVNSDCYGQGWFVAIAPSDSEELQALLSADDYTKLIAVEQH
jgi:glycine cleavage system H protein